VFFLDSENFTSGSVLKVNRAGEAAVDALSLPVLKNKRLLNNRQPCCYFVYIYICLMLNESKMS